MYLLSVFVLLIFFLCSYLLVCVNLREGNYLKVLKSEKILLVSCIWLEEVND